MTSTMREHALRQRQAVDAFEKAISSGVIAQVHDAYTQLEITGTWSGAFQRIGRLGHTNKLILPEKFKRWFLDEWTNKGDDFRDSVNDDRTLVQALLVLLPRYTGPAIQLFRGETFFNRRRRTYGASWTSTQSVAEGFARGNKRCYEGGSVVLVTVAPPEAIVCAPAVLANGYGEDEYLVDRRKLKQVDVINRFPQQTIEENSAQLAIVGAAG